MVGINIETPPFLIKIKTFPHFFPPKIIIIDIESEKFLVSHGKAPAKLVAMYVIQIVL